MNIQFVRNLREERGEILQKLESMADSSRFTAEQKAEFDKLARRSKELSKQIDEAERDLSREVRTGAGRGNGGGRGERTGALPAADLDEPFQTARDQERGVAFVGYLRHGLYASDRGDKGISSEQRSLLIEQRDMGTGGGNALLGPGAGYLVPVGFANKIEQALKYFWMLDSATILDTESGAPLPYPTANDTTIMGEIVGEGQQVSTADVAIGSLNFGSYKFSSKMVRVSLELLQDSAFDIESFLSQQFALRFGRIWSNKFTVGTGTSEPTGILTAATSSGQTVLGDDNSASPDPTTQAGYIDLVNLEHSVDILYRRNAKFMFNDGTLKYLKTLKDKYGRPLWQSGFAIGQPDQILGYEYVINNDMPDLGHLNKPILFGAIDKYVIRRVKAMSVLRLSERFADYGQVGFLGFARVDGNLLDAGTHPVKYLQNS